MTAADKQKLLRLGLATGGGAGIGALMEYLLSGELGWRGATGGALAGGGGYLALSPGARDAVRHFVGYQTPKEKEEQAKRERKEHEQQITELLENSQTLDQRPPTAQELRDKIPADVMSDEAVKALALKLHNRYEGAKEALITGKTGPLSTTAINTANTAVGATQLAQLVAPYMTGTGGALAESLGAAAPTAYAGLVLVDGARNLFYNPATGEYSTHIGDNLRGNQEAFIERTGYRPGSGAVERVSHTIGNIGRGVMNPVRSSSAAGLTMLDAAGANLDSTGNAYDISKKTGNGLTGTIGQLWRSATNTDKAFTPEEQLKAMVAAYKEDPTHRKGLLTHGIPQQIQKLRNIKAQKARQKLLDQQNKTRKEQQKARTKTEGEALDTYIDNLQL